MQRTQTVQFAFRIRRQQRFAPYISPAPVRTADTADWVGRPGGRPTQELPRRAMTLICWSTVVSSVPGLASTTGSGTTVSGAADAAFAAGDGVDHVALGVEVVVKQCRLAAARAAGATGAARAAVAGVAAAGTVAGAEH